MLRLIWLYKQCDMVLLSNVAMTDIAEIFSEKRFYSYARQFLESCRLSQRKFKHGFYFSCCLYCCMTTRNQKQYKLKWWSWIVRFLLSLFLLVSRSCRQADVESVLALTSPHKHVLTKNWRSVKFKLISLILSWEDTQRMKLTPQLQVR